MVRKEYKEIFVLRDMLEKAGIPFVFENGFMNGAALAYPDREHCICSAIEHDYSYGRSDDLIEIMGLLKDEQEKCDSVCGYLSAKNVYERIMKHYQLSNKA